MPMRRLACYATHDVACETGAGCAGSRLCHPRASVGRGPSVAPLSCPLALTHMAGVGRRLPPPRLATPNKTRCHMKPNARNTPPRVHAATGTYSCTICRQRSLYTTLIALAAGLHTPRARAVSRKRATRVRRAHGRRSAKAPGKPVQPLRGRRRPFKRC